MSEWNEWTAKQKGKQLVMSFDGEALKLLGELSNEVLSDYDKLVSELNRRYDPAERAEAWKIEFRNRTRKVNESVMQFAQALKRLVFKAFPNMDASAQEQWVLDQFILGVGNVEIRRHVQFGHPRDVNAAISLAIEYEAFEAGNKDKLRKPANKGDVCASVSTNTKPDPVAKGDEKPKEAETSGDHKYNYDRKNYSEMRGFDKSTVECRYCKKLGHFKNECMILKYKLEREQNTPKEESAPNASTNPQGN